MGAAWIDWRSRTIPNSLVLVLMAMGLMNAAWHNPPLGAVGSAVLASTIGLLCWMPFWVVRMMGGGDVKFFAAASSWLAPALVWRAAVLAALLGGALALLFLTVAKLASVRSMHRAVRDRHGAPGSNGTTSHRALTEGARSIPYGIAMACAVACAYWYPQALSPAQ